MFAEKTFLLGQLAIGDKACVDKLADQTRVEDYIQYKCRNSEGRNDEEDPFFVFDIGRVMDRHALWQSSLPKVQPFYAVKCNNDVILLKTLVALGIGFDCASENEITMILDLGVSPDRIIYANTIKQISHLKYAAKKGVTLMTFDNSLELHKVKEHCPTARLVLRIAADSASSPLSNSTKFGCTISKAKDLLHTASSLDLNVVGVSFHVGSFCMDTHSHQQAVELASKIFHYAASVGYHLTILDIGGGFPGSGLFDDLFKNMAVSINSVLEDFCNFPDLKIIAEPGYFFPCSAYSIAVCVIGKEVTTANGEEPVYNYYVNDGIHGSFSNCFYKMSQTPLVPIILQDTLKSCHLHKTVIWGQTCDSTDKICDVCMPEVNIGDWIFFKEMGGYTHVRNTKFNGFNEPPSYYYVRGSYIEKFSSLMVEQSATNFRAIV